MCGVFYIGEDAEQELWEMVTALNRRRIEGGTPFKSSGVIRPSDTVPVLANNRALRPTPFAMKWGYTLPGKKGLLINARSETAGEKPLFRDGMLQRRCLIPATNYFEWEKTPEGKQKYTLRPKGKNFFWLAGLYRPEAQGAAFTILTRAPAESIAFIHDRMPVILPEEMKGDWLDPRNSPAAMLKSAVLEMEFHPC